MTFPQTHGQSRPTRRFKVIIRTTRDPLAVAVFDPPPRPIPGQRGYERLFPISLICRVPNGGTRRQAKRINSIRSDTHHFAFQSAICDVRDVSKEQSVRHDAGRLIPSSRTCNRLKVCRSRSRRYSLLEPHRLCTACIRISDTSSQPLIEKPCSDVVFPFSRLIKGRFTLTGARHYQQRLPQYQSGQSLFLLSGNPLWSQCEVCLPSGLIPNPNHVFKPAVVFLSQIDYSST